MRSMIVYKAEKELGLEQAILSSGRIAYAAQLAAAPELLEKGLSKAKNFSFATAKQSEQIDLYPLKSILATIGWNKNDDVLSKYEAWMARSSAEDKPFNYEHDCKDIIGHITGSYVIDFDNKLIADDTAFEDVPDSFHIAVSSVLYKYWPDETLLKRMNQIIADIPEGKWYVSMEALFDDFDYAVKAPDGKNYVIARNEESAYLTKKLRAYDGTGVYEDHKIGRLIKNVIFSGKGLTEKPANPNSIIFDHVEAFEKFSKTSAKEIVRAGYSLNENDRDSQHNRENSIMAAEITQVELLQNEIKRLENTVKASVERADSAEKRLVDMNAETVKTKLDALTASVKERDDKISSLNAQVQTEQKARTEAEAKYADLEKKYAEQEKQIAKANQEKTRATRLATVVAELSLAQTDAEKFYDAEIADLNLSDERFNKLVATLKAQKPAVTPPVTEKKQEEKTESTTASVLDKVETNKTAPLGTESVNNTIEQTRAGLSNFLQSNFLGGKKSTKAKTE